MGQFLTESVGVVEATAHLVPADLCDPQLKALSDAVLASNW